jgi:formylglycine-generating enzyme required for sulfatase activity
VKLRIGRKNMRTLYLQVGPEPDDRDLPVGFAVDWHTAQALCAVVNQQTGLRAPTENGQRWEHLAEMARMANFLGPLDFQPGD